MKRIGNDIGGTFTDFVFVDDERGAVVIHKIPSTPDDPSRATVAGLKELSQAAELDPSDLDQLLHGTTVATNIVLEHNGAEVGLITTAGFRDVLHIGRSRKPLTFSAYQDIPWQAFPLVRRRHRLVVSERVIPPSGEIEVPLDEEAARTAIRELREAGVESVAVCFLFSFLNPVHELRVRELLREEWPDAYIVLRHEIAPQFREYEAFSTTCLNAYVGPRVSRYIRSLSAAVASEGFGAQPLIMTSNGGISTSETAIDQAVTLLLSGPVAGLVGGIWSGQASGFGNVITIDVGGTSADIGVVYEGRRPIRHVLERDVAGYHVSTPILDIESIGAGGGSIAEVDSGGMLQVGPKSAGARPGPACYGLGGEHATATDALVVLGRLRPEGFLGGKMTLHPERAREAVARLGDGLKLDAETAAAGILEVLTHSMIQAIEIASVQRGYDPRDFALVAMGGAGPLFGWQLAAEMSIPTVVVPLYPGLASALGLLAADFAYDFSVTTMELLDSADPARFGRLYDELEERARAKLLADGLPDNRIVLRRLADCRYEGQGYELRVAAPTSPAPFDQSWLSALEEAFHVEHQRTYARRFEGRVQVVNLHLEALGLSPGLRLDLPERDGTPVGVALRDTTRMGFLKDGAVRWHEANVYDRAALRAGDSIVGPALVEQLDSTTVVPPGLAASVHPSGNLLVSLEASG